MAPSLTQPTIPSSSNLVRQCIHIAGIVQGVGFRPFVFNLAGDLNLAGFVLNNSDGVHIEVEGSRTRIDQFHQRLRTELPPLAMIDSIRIVNMQIIGEQGFSIRESAEDEGHFVLVAPDVATCDQCFREVNNRNDRRFGYPFTNCTNCGPRYTIIQDIPYDRPKTTMQSFRMCAGCQVEYEDPSDRRFHAQPNACPKCGPSLTLIEKEGFIKGVTPSPDSAGNTIEKVKALLGQGQILAIKGIGGFHLACDAKNQDSVQTLRKRKRRSDKPFALMVRDLAVAERICVLTDADRLSLSSARRPIVILPQRPDSGISTSVSPNNATLGVMLPYTPLHSLLFGTSEGETAAFNALVMTSGNRSEEPIVTRNEDAYPRLHPLADWFLLHDRDIHMRVDDSVLRTLEGKERVLRRSRGYVPHPVDLGIEFSELLACGGELKNTFCLTKSHYAILSQHIGDLENYETIKFFEETLHNLKKLFRVNPQAVAHDLHPAYMSTKLALNMPVVKKVGVQHHHAHIASCMTENGVKEKVIGVAFDGTGYGTDGQIWGGEFLITDFAGFERRAHFRYIPLAGGDAAVRQPWRSALGYLTDTFGDGWQNLSFPMVREIPEKKLQLVSRMIATRINTVQTSSCGRLFDAVASMVGLRQENTFEGQAAIELEQVADRAFDTFYDFEISRAADPWQIDVRPMIRGIMRDLASDKSVSCIAARFHNTIASMVSQVCDLIRKRERLTHVCLSGGTFQNWRLLESTVRELRKAGFTVYLHSKVPPNDGGLSLGQAVIANELLRRGV